MRQYDTSALTYHTARCHIPQNRIGNKGKPVKYLCKLLTCTKHVKCTYFNRNTCFVFVTDLFETVLAVGCYRNAPGWYKRHKASVGVDINRQTDMAYGWAHFGTRLCGPRSWGNEPEAEPRGSVPNYTCGILVSEETWCNMYERALNTVTMLRAERPRNRGSNIGRCKKCFSSTKRPYRLWGPPSP
jgi:hypothetical protein